VDADLICPRAGAPPTPSRHLLRPPASSRTRTSSICALVLRRGRGPHLSTRRCSACAVVALIYARAGASPRHACRCSIGHLVVRPCPSCRGPAFCSPCQICCSTASAISCVPHRRTAQRLQPSPDLLLYCDFARSRPRLQLAYPLFVHCTR
jgi:hypothetical protein